MGTHKIFRLVPSLALAASLCTPLFVAAQTPNLGAIKPYSDVIIGLINSILIPILMAIALLVFLWGIYKYFILGAADETSRVSGRHFVLWGIIGFAIIVSVWGLVAVVSGAFGIPLNTQAPEHPTF